MLNNICSSYKVLQKLCSVEINSNIYLNVTQNTASSNLIFTFLLVSSATKRCYDSVLPTGPIYLNYHSHNFIYLITCCRCSFQYVGKTVQKLNERFNLIRQN